MPVIDTVKGRKARKTTAFQELQKKELDHFKSEDLLFYFVSYDKKN